MHFAELSQSMLCFLRRECGQRGERSEVWSVAGFYHVLHEHMVQVFREADVRHGLEK